jgi:hypothetical protein
MKVLYEAVDGYTSFEYMTEAELKLELKHHEILPYSAISSDGVSKLSPYDTESEIVFSKAWKEQNL